jgi:hypothetical protein
MPVVLRIGKYRFVIYVFDHEPAHVHVKSDDAEAIFYLNCPAGPVSLRKNFGFGASEVNQVLHLVRQNLEVLCAAWKALHEN